jgi:triacylglycerol lipase
VHYRAARAQQQLSPVLCYVHGGGFTGGDKSKPGQPYYDNVGAWAVGVGFVGVTITYRYAPESTFPAGAEDIARALSFIEEEIADFGGDPRRIVVMGHSAGAAHVATFVANPSLRAGMNSGPAGAILSSGVYDPSIVPSAYGEYFGVDQHARRSMSAIPGLVATEIPLLISSAQFDPPETLSHTRKLLRAFDEGEAVIPLYIQVDGHNHYSVIYQFNSAEQWYTGRIFRFVNSLARVG